MLLECWQELDTKVQGLHEQRMKQLSLERECSRLRQEVDRLAVLQPLLEGQHCVHACHSHTHSTHHSLLSDAPCDIHAAAFVKHAIILQPDLSAFCPFYLPKEDCKLVTKCPAWPIPQLSFCHVWVAVYD